MKIKKDREGYIHKRGYVVLYKPKHENAWADGHIYEHVCVMSEFLNRPLKKGESVHHINGDRQDNRIENLELWNTAQPGGQRLCDKLKFSLDFLRSYGYEIKETANVI